MALYGRTVIVTAEVKDRFALAEWIDHRSSSVRKVAELATRMSEREKDKHGKTTPLKVNASTVGHLVSGHQKRTSARRAELIEKALDVPRGSLFAYKLTNVQSADSRELAGASR